jgi:hypothetical protein
MLSALRGAGGAMVCEVDSNNLTMIVIETFDDVLKYIEKNPHPFFQTPFFRNYILQQQEAYNQETDVTDKYQFIRYTIKGQAFSVVANSILIQNVWPDVSIDRYRTNIDLLGSCIDLSFFNPDLKNSQGNAINKFAIKWCNEKMRPATFFVMIRRYMEKNDLMALNSQLKDTFSQLSKLISAYKIDVQPPSRWRMDTFHDFVSGLYLEYSTENVDFEDNSIKESYTEGKYKVYQPKDRVTLAKWGNKVRNCVLSYSEKILQKESEIVFIEEDGVPRYTVEINYGPLETKHVNIKQLQASCRRINDTGVDERGQCQQLIEKAVGLRK